LDRGEPLQLLKVIAVEGDKQAALAAITAADAGVGLDRGDPFGIELATLEGEAEKGRIFAFGFGSRGEHASCNSRRTRANAVPLQDEDTMPTPGGLVGDSEANDAGADDDDVDPVRAAIPARRLDRLPPMLFA